MTCLGKMGAALAASGTDGGKGQGCAMNTAGSTMTRVIPF